MIQYLIEHGANIYDFMKQHGYKYLIRACEEQDETYIKYLVKYGTDINKKRVTHTKINGIKDKYKFNIYMNFMKMNIIKMNLMKTNLMIVVKMNLINMMITVKKMTKKY